MTKRRRVTLPQITKFIDELRVSRASNIARRSERTSALLRKQCQDAIEQSLKILERPVRGRNGGFDL